MINNLLNELKEVLNTKRPKRIHPVLAKFDHIALDDNMQDMIEKIREYIDEYEYDKAIDICL